MSHAATTQFLDGLRATRLLDDARIDELRSRPEAVWGDVASLQRHAEQQGWLTPYQLRELDEGRGDGLIVGTYRIVEKLSDGSSGPVFKALHPALVPPVRIHVLRPDWLSPADTTTDFVARAQAASLVQSPHLSNVLDAGLHGESPFVVLEYVDGADLFRFINEMGARSVGVACEYARQAALALEALHAKGIVHGQVSPRSLVITPIEHSAQSNGDGSIRPKPGATIKLAELGVTPIRPPIGEITYGQSDRLGPVEFFAPERLTQSERSPAGDMYGLGASLYFLLTARPPHAGASPLEAMLQLQQAEPPAIESLRSDLPPAVAALIGRLLSRDPAIRPSANEVIEALKPYCEVAAQPVPGWVADVPLASETATHSSVPSALVVANRIDEPEEKFEMEIPEAPAIPDDPSPPAPEIQPLDEFPSSSGVLFSPSSMGTDAPRTAKPKVRAPYTTKQKAMVVLGLCLHLTATVMCLGAFGVIPNPFAPSTEKVAPKGEDKEKKPDEIKKKRPRI